jgi:hypothetical protein
VGHDFDDVCHHGYMTEVLQHFDPRNDAIECKKIFPHHDPKSGIIIGNVNMVCWRKTFRLIELARLGQSPESTQVSNSEQSEVGPVHNKPSSMSANKTAEKKETQTKG